MQITFSSMVRRGEEKGEALEPWTDKGGNFVLCDPAKRHGGRVYVKDCVPTPSAEEARKLIEDQGFSMRMRIRGGSEEATRMVRANRIEIEVTSRG